ncbi:MAG: hypothetical protein ABIN67_03555 [Ferruginibacter sp.]
MKSILSYLLLCVYATILVKPVMPTLADTFAHILNYSDHITTVHHENGKYHVHYEYVEAAKKNSSEQAPYNNLSKKLVDASEHVMLIATHNLSPTSFEKVYLNLPIQRLQLMSLPGCYRPPIVFHY